MTRALVSVIVPTFNRSTLVTRAVDSALGQTHSEIEVIVVDDGSTDSTAATIATRYEAEPRVRYVAIDNVGPAGARNRGIETAAGTHVAFLDSDDEWLPWKTEFQLRWLGELPDVGMIWSDMEAIDPDGRLLAPRFIRTFYWRHSEVDIATILESRRVVGVGGTETNLYHGDLYRDMLLGNLVHTSTVLMTRERLEAVGGFDTDLRRTGEDFDFHLRTCRAGPVAFADVSAIRYQVGAPDQLTRQDLMVPMARNYLTTIDKALGDDEGRITPRLRRSAASRAHAWLGNELLTAGARTEARFHIRRGLRSDHRPRTVVRWILSWLPAWLDSASHRLISPVRRRSAG